MEQRLDIEEDFQKINTRIFYKTLKTKLTSYQPQNFCFEQKTIIRPLIPNNCVERSENFKNFKLSRTHK